MTRKEEQENREEMKEETSSPRVEEDIAALRSKVAEKEREAAENYDRYLRAMAELDNFRKRTRVKKKRW